MTRVMALRAKACALAQCARFCRWGADWKSRQLLFYIGILVAIYPTRRVRLFRHLQATLSRAAEGGVLALSLQPPSVPGDGCPFTARLRAGDRADYQSIWECLNEDLYRPPGTPVYHVLDGGANLGFFTLALTRFPAIRDVVAVEPNPGNLALLRQNLAGFPRATLVTAALSAQAGDAHFLLEESNTGHLGGSTCEAESSRSIRVPCVRLPDALPMDWDMDHTWLKLDIEGAEYEVLRDLLQTERRPVAISAEIHDYAIAGGGTLIHELEQAGYHVQTLDPGSPGNLCRQICATRTIRHEREGS